MIPENPISASAASPSLKRAIRLARWILQERRRRDAAIGAHHFADPVWDMLLDLFAAQAEGARVATSSLVIAACVPQSTALRRIRSLVFDGIFIEHPDPTDGRRTYLSLDHQTFDSMHRFFNGLLARLVGLDELLGDD